MIELIGKEFPVLDKGSVRLLDYMGSDSDICSAARVSYGKGTKSVSDDKALLRYLIRNNHSSPMEMVELKFLIKCPIYIARQIFRHRTFSFNEESQRYSVVENEYESTSSEEWRLQSDINKQGSSNKISEEIGNNITLREITVHHQARIAYEQRINVGIAREQARKILPLDTYTKFIMKADLRNLLHFLKLRLDSHAQLEIRQYANVIAGIVQNLFPETWSAFSDYILNAITFSAAEISLLKAINNKDNLPIDKLSKRELIEFNEKMNKLGISPIGV